jgi:hypothetical protein
MIVWDICSGSFLLAVCKILPPMLVSGAWRRDKNGIIGVS